MDTTQFNKTVIDDFRANNGVVGGPMAGMPLLILTNTGAKTGKQRENPLAYIMDGERYIIIASFAGNANHPPWYHNLVANPEVSVEVGGEQFSARAEVLAEPERSRLYAAVAEKMPIFSEYQNKTTRTIPVIALLRV